MIPPLPRFIVRCGLFVRVDIFLLPLLLAVDPVRAKESPPTVEKINLIEQPSPEELEAAIPPGRVRDLHLVSCHYDTPTRRRPGFTRDDW